MPLLSSVTLSPLSPLLRLTLSLTHSLSLCSILVAPLHPLLDSSLRGLLFARSVSPCTSSLSCSFSFRTSRTSSYSTTGVSSTPAPIASFSLPRCRLSLSLLLSPAPPISFLVLRLFLSHSRSLVYLALLLFRSRSSSHLVPRTLLCLVLARIGSLLYFRFFLSRFIFPLSLSLMFNLSLAGSYQQSHPFLPLSLSLPFALALFLAACFCPRLLLSFI